MFEMLCGYDQFFEADFYFDPRAYADLRPAGFFRALRMNAKRAAIQHARNMNINLFDMLLHIVTGTFLGGASGEHRR